MSMVTKFGYGAKGDVAAAITDGKIDNGDVVITKDTDEIAFITQEEGVLTPKFMKSRSEKAYTLNGTTLGALANGATIPAGISMDEFLAMITEKAIAPTYNAPSTSIAQATGGTKNGNYEAGTTITPKITGTFNQKDAGALTNIQIFKGSEEVGNSGTSPYTYEGDDFVLGDETISYTAKSTYEAGAIKNDNTGKPNATGAIGAGSKTSSAYSFTGQRNLFYGTGVGNVPEVTSDMVRGLASKQLNPAAGTVFNIPVEVGQQYVAFAYPATLRDVTQVMYVETNDTGMAGNFTKTTKDVADARGGTNGLTSYKVYTYGMAKPAAAAMTFKVTI